MKIEDTECPKCGEKRLRLSQVFDLKPFGSVSLAGAQLKTEGRFRPSLTCGNCGFELLGEFGIDGRHMTFQLGEGS